MWIYRSAVAMFALVVISSSVLVHADVKAAHKGPAKREDSKSADAIKKQYDKISHAILTKNIKSIQEVTTPDYTLSTPNGQVVTRQQMEAQMMTSLSFLQKITSAKSALTNYKVKGNEAKVDVAETVEGVISDPQTQGKIHTLSTTNRYHDTWVKSGGNWLRKHSDVVKIAITMDGKPFDIGGALSGAPRAGKDGMSSTPKK